MHTGHKPVAIGARLKMFPQIQTIGFKPNFNDYTAIEKKQILDADKIYYPTVFYAELLNIMGKKTFPSFHTYRFALDKISQTAIFQMQGIAHPLTKVYYGNRQKALITEDFTYPFIAKKARGSARGDHVYLIHSENDLSAYLENNSPAYIQEYIPIEKDMRIIVIGKKVRLAYWRIPKDGDFKTNLAKGAAISFDPVPEEAISLALETAQKCGWDDVGIDIVQVGGRLYVLEGNMKYGTKGFQAAGINYKKLLLGLIEKKEI